MMQNSQYRSPSGKREKNGLDLAQLKQKAEEILRNQTCCLLIADIIQSGLHHGFSDRTSQQKAFIETVDSFNEKFDADMPVNDLRLWSPEKGVKIFSGDSFCFGIDKTQWIDILQEYLKQRLPATSFRWSVGKDWSDKEAFKIC